MYRCLLGDTHVPSQTTRFWTSFSLVGCSLDGSLRLACIGIPGSLESKLRELQLALSDDDGSRPFLQVSLLAWNTVLSCVQEFVGVLWVSRREFFLPACPM